mmetsp:Transcript_58742/g.137544  ORF Transcript_58742/g.137544 Transcript_58742/m.137544 type:complete len:552 (-) Transcript_58742:95-1750(-)
MQNHQACFNGQALRNPLAGLKHSVVLADPSLGDSIIIGCSDGFFELSGFSRMEVIGQPCCFMTEGCFNQPSLMQAMTSAIANGDEFLGVMVSRRKTGEQFSNLLHLFSVAVGGKRYILQLQADVTNAAVNLADPTQVSHLRQVAVAILSADVDTWVLQQLAEFYRLRLRKPLDMNQLLLNQVGPQELPTTPPAACSLLMPQTPPAATAAQFMPPPLPTQQLYQSKEVPSNMMQMPMAPNRQTDRVEWPVAAAPPLPKESMYPYGGQPQKSQWHAALKKQDNDFTPSAGGSMGSEGGDDDRRQQVEGAPSIGSAGHPEKCTECQFHFFSSSGCRMGEDCRFCHLFHPRKCQRKNRKILKRLESNMKVEEEVLAPPASSICFPGTEKGTVDVKTFRYLKEVFPTKQGGRPPRATFQVGSKLRLIPTVEFEDPRGQAILPSVTFAINPPLPEGIVLNENTGVISGAAIQASPRDLYTVTMCAEAETLSGISIGSVPLAKCCMSIRILTPKAAELNNDDDQTELPLARVAEKTIDAPLRPEIMPHMMANDRQAGG